MKKIIIRLSKVKTLWLLAFVCLILPMEAYSQKYGSFPYQEPFKKAQMPADISRPSVSNGTNAAGFTNIGLRLTEPKTQQFGAIFVNNRQFGTENGIKIEFEYMVFGGGTTGADGFSVFLFDAEVTTPTIGAKGAGLGYAYNRAIFSSYGAQRNKGLSGAYLGIGFDSFGNFNAQRFQGESMVNGILNGSSSVGGSNVTIRGAEGKPDPAYVGAGARANEEGFSGYPVLISQSTTAINKNRIINETDGGYDAFSTSLENGDVFNIRGNGAFNDGDVKNAAYRKAIIELYPLQPSGMSVTVKIIRGSNNGAVESTVIDNFEYKDEFAYEENSYNNNGGDVGTTLKAITKKITLDTSAPKFLRLGFAASTGSVTDNHYIKNLRVTLPSSAIANDDEGILQSNFTSTINPLKNDLGFTGPVAPNQQGRSGYLNRATFRFLDDNNNPITGTTYTNTSGTWVYNISDGKLTYTGTPGFKGTATVKYDIKAGKNNEQPYADEAYRSLSATVSVKVKSPAPEPQPEVKGILTNRMLQPRIIK